MVKILAIGDPHGSDKIKKIPISRIKPDLILIPGDLGKADLAREFFFKNIERQNKGLEKEKPSKAFEKKMYLERYKTSLGVVRYLSKFAPTYTIFGNADYYNYDVRKLAKKIGMNLPFMYNDLNSIKNVRVINNIIANFDGLRIGGLEMFKDINWIRDFKPKDYQKQMKKAKKGTSKAKRILRGFKGVDILLCHQPPYKILDKVGFPAPKIWHGKYAGSIPILDFIKKQQPKLVLCGHIHENKGMKMVGKTQVYNLGCSGDYEVIDIE